jgi:hypothetical protein
MNNKTIKNLAIVLVSILAISTLFSAFGTVKAAGGTLTMSAPPSELAVGSTFSVDLSIAGASNVWQWTVRDIFWNSSVLQAMSVTEGPWLKQGGTLLWIVPSSTLTTLQKSQIQTVTTVFQEAVYYAPSPSKNGYGSTAIIIKAQLLSGMLQTVAQRQPRCNPWQHTTLPPPPPTAPTSEITSPTDGAFLLQVQQLHYMEAAHTRYKRNCIVNVNT